ncbi:helix-turn-helix domain-containing protein [Saccharopolyspora flava]|uniref:helix-turn-helix domain-containing protein n=1 Tax=Saccharopolyspora flava TaxID=95161 RepID=UPI001FE69C58|nr:helix-turn-helix domain-containing protein [Saccharopolyspora flava]
MLREVRRQVVRGRQPDLAKMLDLIARHADAQIALLDEPGRIRARTKGFPDEVLPGLSGLLGRMSAGELDSASTREGALHVQCEALGHREPRPVLVVAGDTAPDQRTASLVSEAGSLLVLLLHAHEGERARRAYDDKARQVRVGVMHALLSGEPTLARRMTSGAVPPLLDAERLRVYLLRCTNDERDRIVRFRQDPFGYHGSDLLVQCPVFDDHLICLVAEQADRDDALETSLRAAVRDNDDFSLGVSGAQPLSATAEAYAQAAHALTAARITPERVAHFHGRCSLGEVLGARGGQRWARAFLAPLREAPKTSVDITRLSMMLPRSGVAKLLGFSRNTVAAHLARVERSLGVDLADVRSRAAVNLALALSGTGDEGPPDAPESLPELLRSESAASWARGLLRPLDERFRRTLRAWIDANADARRAAGELGISRNTVRAHLVAAESALGRDLLTTGGGVHDVVHAFDALDG